jgi:hypothetical protein
MSGNGGTVHEADRRLPNVMAGMEKTLERELGRSTPEEVKRPSFATRAPLQTIADAGKRLVWDDNEKLAMMISTHYQAGGETASMAAALQRAFDDLINEDNSSRQ